MSHLNWSSEVTHRRLVQRLLPIAIIGGLLRGETTREITLAHSVGAANTTILRAYPPAAAVNLAFQPTQGYVSSIGGPYITFIADADGIQRPYVGPNQSTFNYPSGVAIDSKGRIFVADTVNSRIQMFDSEGNFLQVF